MADDGQSPTDRVDATLEEALGLVGEAKEADGVVEAVGIENEAVQMLADAMARELVDGWNQPVGPHASILSDETKHFTKTDVKAIITDRVEELRGAEGPPPLNEFIQNRLDRVEVTKTTDRNQGAIYSWDFGTFRVETRSGRDGRGHFDWSHFRDVILESGSRNVGRPPRALRDGDDWREFMVGIIEDRGETREAIGPRTRAVERLKNRIANVTGYGTVEAALDLGGIWAIRDTVDLALPEWWAGFGPGLSEERDLPADGVTEVRVPESTIDQAVDDLDVNRSGLYHELRARGHTLPEMRGVSIVEWVDGSQHRFWVLRPTLAVPGIYVVDPRAEPRSPAPTFDTGDTQTTDSGMAADGDGDADGFESVGRPP